MKRIITTALAAIIALSASALDFSIGVEVGYDNVRMVRLQSRFDKNDSWTKLNSDERKALNNSLFGREEKTVGFNGFHIGPKFNLGFTENIGLNFGLLYQAAFNSEKRDLGIEVTDLLHQHSLQLPIRFQYKYNFGDFGVMAVAGPVLNFTCALNEKFSADGQWEEVNYISGKYKNSDDESYTDDSLEMFDVFDLKLGLGAGASYKNFYLLFTYDWGLLNRVTSTNDLSDNASMNFDDIKVSLGYNF